MHSVQIFLFIENLQVINHFIAFSSGPSTEDQWSQSSPDKLNNSIGIFEFVKAAGNCK